MFSNTPSVDENEVKKFSDIANEWWNEQGSFKPLHAINPVRIRYIRDKIINHFNIDDAFTPLKNINMLDVGCGGGLLSVPLSRIGANITGIDVSLNNINIANSYKQRHQLQNITFKRQSVEDLKDEKFDVVLVMEVIEHINDLNGFLRSCIDVLNDNGLIFISTINKTFKSYIFAIIFAEYIFKVLPKKTHSWDKFLEPFTINQVLEKYNIKTMDLIGVKYNPLTNKCALSDDTLVNYMTYGVKR